MQKKNYIFLKHTLLNYFSMSQKWNKEALLIPHTTWEHTSSFAGKVTSMCGRSYARSHDLHQLPRATSAGSSCLQKLCCLSGLLCPLRVGMSFCEPHTPSPHPDSAAACWKLHPAFCQGFKQVILTPSLTHTHTLSPQEEIKSQMRGAWGGISQTSVQELCVRLSSKLSKLQLQWKYYTCSSLKLCFHVVTTHEVPHGHTWPPRQYLGMPCLPAWLYGLLLPENQDEEYWNGTECLYKGKKISASQEHKPFKPFMPWPFYVFCLFPHDSIGTQHPHTQHLLSKKNLMKTPKNTASWLNSFLKSFPKRGDLVLI